MLSTLLIVLIVLWVLGMVTSYTLGGLVYGTKRPNPWQRT